MLNRTRLLFGIITFIAFTGVAHAQGAASATDPFGRQNNKRDESLLGSPEAEMRARLEIQRAQKLRRENLERAREVAQLGLELRDAYTKNRSLARDEVKKLERLEKLTRRIRSESGGSDDKETDADIPRELDSALTRIAELTAELRKGVEKTPRLVISASVIERTNQLLEIITFVRTLTHQNN